VSVRRAALEALLDITDGGAYANLRLKQALDGMEARDARWTTALVYTALDHLYYIDIVIAAYAKGRLKPQIRGILRLGVCQALYMDVPDSAACDESVKLAKEIGKGALSGYVNGVMRAVCRGRESLPPLPEEPRARISVQYSWPRFMVDEYVDAFGADFTSAMLSYENHGMTIRAQYPYTAEELAAELGARGVEYSRGPLVSDAFRLSKGLNVAEEPLFVEGRIAVQSESAMLACRALFPKAGMSILDACAAPGGKTAYIASLTQNQAHITAWELHEHRAELMRRTLERLGVSANVAVADASAAREELIEGFDAVLVDAPCSGLGVFGKPDARYAKSDEVIAGLTKLQREILSACAGYVKRGGALVYATCTISRRENEEQIAAFLREHEEFEAGELTSLLPKAMWRRAGGGMIQLFPHVDDTEGFFIARLIRR